ncbi:hypothetical protein EniLVp02_0025 [Vibrio phage EniLVp02]
MMNFAIIVWLLAGMVIWGKPGSEAMDTRQRLLPPNMKWHSPTEFVVFYVLGSWGLLVNLLLYVVVKWGRS